MTILKVIAASSAVIVAALAACSSGGGRMNHNTGYGGYSSPSIYTAGGYSSGGYPSSNTYQNTATTMANADYNSSGNYMHNSSVGQIMTTPNGMTVYTSDADSLGVSN